MDALLTILDTKEDLQRALAICKGRKAKIIHRTHKVELTDEILQRGYFSTNFGGYGSASGLAVGPTFGGRWRVDGIKIPRGKTFTALRVCFFGSEWARPVEELTKLVEARGGKVVNDSAKADIVVGSGKLSPAKREAVLKQPGTLLVTQEVFARSIPGPKSEPLEADAAKLWQMLSARDVNLVQQGLELLSSLDDATVFGALLDGVAVKPEDGSLIRGPRFSGTKPAQVFLDVALLGVLSLALEGSIGVDVRSKVRTLSLKLAGLPKLIGFSSLESLRIELPDRLTIDDLKIWGPLPNLKRLTISNTNLSSLAGLAAPLLEELVMSNLDLAEVSALEGCSHLRVVEIANNPRLTSIDALKSATNLETLLVSSTSITSLDGVAGGTSLTRVDVSSCSALKSVAPLKAHTGLRLLQIEGCIIVSPERFTIVTQLLEVPEFAQLGFKFRS